MPRGDVHWAELEPRSGSEQRGRRPVVIVSHDRFNLHPTWRSMLVVPLTTSTAPSRVGPTAVPVPAGVAGLERDSIALCHQVTTLDRAKLGDRIGRLPADVLELLEAGLMHALDL